jgi:high-affinity Fe2+/Pb2+ permease
MTPRKVIGTVDTSEFLVAVAASIGFFIGIGSEDIPWKAVAALLIGGLIAAPIAAYLVRHVPTRLLGASVGGLIVVTNLRTLLNAFEVDNSIRPELYAVAFTVWAVALGLALQGLRRDRREEAAQADSERQRELTPA